MVKSQPNGTIVNVKSLASGLVIVAVLLASLVSQTPASGRSMFYIEVPRNGQIYVFAIGQRYDAFLKTGGTEAGTPVITRPGYGPNRETIVFEDTEGRALCKIQGRVLRVRDSMEIEDADGNRIAMVKKAVISPLRERWVVDRPDAPDLRVQGNVLDHEYEIEQDGAKVAEVSKRWFRVRDTYGVEIAPGQDDVLVLAVTAAIDAMTGGRD